ncbi:hypothetical protein X975_17016, partial [Stegodyphus mimosarum]
MELTEEMKTCISLAQTLSSEAQDVPENFKKDKQETMQHLGALLASNCQKICIGPSFHLYASESSMPGSDKSSEMSDNRIKNSTEVIVEEDSGEEFETIFYHGPSVTQETNSIYECQNDTKTVCDEVDKSDSINLTPMNIKLAQANVEYGSLLSPDFFRKNFDISSSAASRYSDSSSGIGSSSESPASQLEQSQKQKAAKLPFVFPKVLNSECKKPKSFQETLSHVLERVEIIDDIKEETKETWEEWPKKFIEENGFCLGVEPGIFYKSSTGPFFYVAMPHRSAYEILVTNNKQIACDVDIYVDGKPVAALRLSAGDSRAIDGPTYAEFAFKLFRSKDAPPGLGVVEGNIENGVLKAIFTPQKVETCKERAFSDPLIPSKPDDDILGFLQDEKEDKRKKSLTIGEKCTAERSFDVSEIVEGATLLQGPKKKRHYLPASPMETDVSKQVTLILRLVASTKREVEASSEKISCLQPPPVPSRRER